MEEIYEFLEGIRNSDTLTVDVNVSELKEEEEKEEEEKEEEHARMMNQAQLGHLLRTETAQRCKAQPSITDSCGRIYRIDPDPATTSNDVYRTWPLQKHDECWVERIHNVILLFGQGKKQHSGTGTIEAHVNGFTYSEDHGDCDQIFMHRNVEWYFYQLGTKKKPPLMQFHLKHPVKIRNTETKDIQFLLVPKVTSYKDSDKIRKTRFTSRFNVRKPRLSSSSRNKDLKRRNKELKKFVHKVPETQFAVKTGLPWIRVKFQALDEFQFDAAHLPTGAPTVCALTRYNLVVLKEAPYLVVPLWDIQIVNLARVGPDVIEMTVVFRDLERDVLQLRSIPLEFLAGIKDRLNRDDVKYYVNNLRPNWKELVSEVRERPEMFIAKGGWDIFEDSHTLAHYPRVDSCSGLESAKTTLGEIPDEEIPDEEIPDEEIPDEFLDPILFTLMKDPVILPSRNTVDRTVIQRHLLDVNWDPYNHCPLTQDMLIPDVELKARIDEFIKSQRSKKHSSEEIPVEEIPNEFLDPFLFTLMKDPVILPSSRITVDRPVIQQHLLEVNWDPYNHCHLTQEMLIPNAELKARIEEFIKSRGLKKHGSEGKPNQVK